ncbi:MAG: DsbC family protein, partial [Woeseiaceae bacterium]|nr:DsbC family protein [Woeseiaceae bacterium]
MTPTLPRLCAALVAGTLLALGAGIAIAADDDAETAAAKQRIAAGLEGIEPRHIEKSPVPGLYKVQKGTIVGYVSADGRYLFQGELIDMTTDVNLTAQARNQVRLDMLADVDESQYIRFSPDDVRHSITVFTDLDCTYCRRLHSQIDEYLAQGIEVKYLLWPRSDQGSEGWARAEKVFCAPDRNSALTAAKRDQSFATEACDASAVSEQFALGVKMGV